MIYILAGNREQAMVYAKTHRFKQWRYISGAYCLRGIGKFKFVKVGAWWNHHQLDEINDMLLRDGKDVTNDL